MIYRTRARLWLGTWLTAVALMSRAAAAQATPFVPPTDVVYRDIERLSASGLIDTLVLGARPFSEREIVRLLNEAGRELASRRDMSWAAATVRRDLSRFSRGAPKPLDALSAEAAHMDSPYRAAPADSNGRTDALVNPLASYREGRPIADGETETVETEHSAILGDHVALRLNPRFTVRSSHGSGTTSTLALQSGAANLSFGNLSVEAGRDYSVFGQAPTGGLLLSDNAPAFDMVRISNDRPAALPWLLRFLGPMRGSLFIADLGKNEFHPHAQLAGYHVASLPRPHLELGVEVIDAMGGRGGQPASFGDRILDAVPIFDVLRANSDFQFSNKMAAVDFHWRMPSWRGFEVYGQGAIDDFDARRLKSVLLEDGGYLVGTSVSCMLDCGRLGIRAEYHQTGIRFYAHPEYPIEDNGVLLGDPLGPRGLGGYVTVDGDLGNGGRLTVAGSFESRSGNGYGSAASGAHTTGFHFFQVFHRPAEKRTRGTLAWARQLSWNGGRTSVQLTGGAERASNFAFVMGSERTNWLASAGFTIRP